MALAAILTTLSYRATFLVLAVFLVGSMSLILVIMWLQPSPYMVPYGAALAILLVVTIAWMVWVVRHPEMNGETRSN